MVCSTGSMRGMSLRTNPRDGLRTMTLPFEGGLEFTVRAH
jgi:hypothetical protein